MLNHPSSSRPTGMIQRHSKCPSRGRLHHADSVPLLQSTSKRLVDAVGSHTLANVLAQIRYRGAVAACGLAGGADLPATVLPFILRGVMLLGIDSANCAMGVRQRIWNKLAVEWRPDGVHDQVRTIDFDELPAHFDAYLKGMVRGRTVVRIGADAHP